MVGEDAQPDELKDLWKDFWGAEIPQTLGSESGITDGPGFPSRMQGQIFGYREGRADEVGLQVVPAVFCLWSCDYGTRMLQWAF